MMKLYTTPRKIDAGNRSNTDISFRRLLTANPTTTEFEQVYNLALSLDEKRVRKIIQRRFQKLQKTKAWRGYGQFRGNGVQRVPHGFLWMRRLEELAGFAAENIMEKTARQVHDVYR